VRKLQSGNYSNIGIIILTACIIAPITEELIFRGMIYPLLKKEIGVFWGCAISSIVFSVIHFNVLSFAVLFAFSCCLTYTYETKVARQIIEFERRFVNEPLPYRSQPNYLLRVD